MDALTCIWLRSLAMTKRMGACSEAATVWPTSTLRAMTTPSMGARMTVWPRSTCAWLTLAPACVTAALAAFSCGDRAVVVGLGRLQVGGRQELLRGQGLGPLELLLGVLDGRARTLHVGLGRGQVRLHLAQPRLEQGGVEPGDDLALLDRGVEVGVQRLDGARHLRADLHRGHRLQGPRGADHVHHVAALGRRRRVARGGLPAAEGEEQRQGRRHDGDPDDQGAARQLHTTSVVHRSACAPRDHSQMMYAELKRN